MPHLRHRPDQATVEQLTRQLTGVPYPATSQDLKDFATRLLLPPWVLRELEALPSHLVFWGADEIGDYLRHGDHAVPLS